MSNIIQTFNSFNCGMKRPNRKKHLELCGFEFYREMDCMNENPMAQSRRMVDAKSLVTGKRYHAVYLRMTKDKSMNGDTGYNLWIKEL